MDLQGPDQLTPPKILRRQDGFAATVFLTILPVILAGLFFLLFSQYFKKNWMQSLYICRSELLQTQTATGQHLKKLMALNAQARFLRVALNFAYAELAAGYATENPILIARAQQEIQRIKAQQKRLDVQQKTIIFAANTTMMSGVQKVASLLHRQNQWNQARMPDTFSYQIRSISPAPKLLAVKPDRPEIAPVYELKNDFTQEQALRVSWTSAFQTRSKETFRWLSNRHQIKQSCSASLKESGSSYPSTLIEDKPWSRL